MELEGRSVPYEEQARKPDDGARHSKDTLLWLDLSADRCPHVLLRTAFVPCGEQGRVVQSIEVILLTRNPWQVLPKWRTRLATASGSQEA